MYFAPATNYLVYFVLFISVVPRRPPSPSPPIKSLAGRQDDAFMFAIAIIAIAEQSSYLYKDGRVIISIGNRLGLSFSDPSIWWLPLLCYNNLNTFIFSQRLSWESCARPGKGVIVINPLTEFVFFVPRAMGAF